MLGGKKIPVERRVINVDPGSIRDPADEDHGCVYPTGGMLGVWGCQVPTYYKVVRCHRRVRIAYWWYWGYNDAPSGSSAGNHHGDWEHIVVTLGEPDPKLDLDAPDEDTRLQAWDAFVKGAQHHKGSDGKSRVTFFQHAGWYTHPPSWQPYPHPRVYVGKRNHGTYHDDGGSGTTCYWEDWRNPGSPWKYWLKTWENLRQLTATGSADDDGDGQIDEDPIAGIDNDGDGAVDEDPEDGIDNDGDGAVDEDGYDDDGDGRIDEDDFEAWMVADATATFRWGGKDGVWTHPTIKHIIEYDPKDKNFICRLSDCKGERTPQNCWVTQGCKKSEGWW